MLTNVFHLTLTVFVNFMSPPPLENLWKVYGRVSFLSSSPYTMTKIHKKRNFVIFSIINLPWYTPSMFALIYTFSNLPWYTFSQWKWHKKWWSMYLFRPVPKKNFRTGKSIWIRGGEINYTKTVKNIRVNSKNIIMDKITKIEAKITYSKLPPPRTVSYEYQLGHQ